MLFNQVKYTPAHRIGELGRRVAVSTGKVKVGKKSTETSDDLAMEDESIESTSDVATVTLQPFKSATKVQKKRFSSSQCWFTYISQTT